MRIGETEGGLMETAQHNQIADFIWSIADDVLRDLYVRRNYRDVILPMIVLRRFDAVLETPTWIVLDSMPVVNVGGQGPASFAQRILEKLPPP